MLSYQTVEPHTLELLKLLMQESMLSSYRLVGGTSLALQFGHRRSVDLDFFGQSAIDGYMLADKLKSIGKVEIIKDTEHIKIYILDGVKIDFVNYQYPWIDKPVLEDGIILASPKDIAAMKVNAVEGRGTKKDFIDMYVLLQHYSLSEIIEFYKQKYPEHSLFRAIMSLSYFDDADDENTPQMFIPESWETMKNVILHEAKNYQNRL